MQLSDYSLTMLLVDTFNKSGIKDSMKQKPQANRFVMADTKWRAKRAVTSATTRSEPEEKYKQSKVS